MIDYYIGIPTYKRPKKQSTLDYLERIGMPKENIVMAVQTLEDYEEYKREGHESRTGALIYREAKNLSENRNTIMDYLGEGKRVVILDDDIHYVGMLNKGVLEPIETLEEFESLIKKGYWLAAKNHTELWGVYPTYNAYYMENKTSPRNIIEGKFMGIMITDLRYNPKFDTKEDYEYSCRVIQRYGAAVRLDNYACNAPKHNAGGCSEFWKKQEEAQKVAKTLVGRYPDILRMNPRRPGEVLMKRGR